MAACVCIHVCVWGGGGHACVCTGMCILCVDSCVGACVSVHACVCVCVCACVCVCMRTCICPCIILHVWVHACTQSHACMCMHAHVWLFVTVCIYVGVIEAEKGPSLKQHLSANLHTSLPQSCQTGSQLGLQLLPSLSSGTGLKHKQSHTHTAGNMMKS